MCCKLAAAKSPSKRESDPRIEPLVSLLKSFGGVMRMQQKNTGGYLLK